jgi:CubicO group peptidase (beta-lactamase class C family)
MRHFLQALCLVLCLSRFAECAAGPRGDLLGERINGFIAEKRTPGLVLMIAKDGEILLHEAYGYADIERQRPLRKDDIFRLYSMSKPLTAAAMLKLVEHRRLRLDTTLQSLLPQFRQAEPITIQQLLTHTAGFPYGGSWTSIAGWRYWWANPLDQENKTLQQMIAALGELPLMHKPGEQWLYGMASDVQGAVIQKASGRELPEYLRAMVLEPLGMLDTAFFVEPARQHRLVPQYQYDTDEKTAFLDDEPDLFKQPPKLVSGGGGMVGTAPDYMRFVQMLLDPDSHARVLAPQLTRAMITNQLPASVDAIPQEVYANSGYGYGVGVKLRDEAHLRRGSFYWAGSGGTLFWADPQRGVAVVAMMQLKGARTGLEKRLTSWVDEWLKQKGH